MSELASDIWECDCGRRIKNDVYQIKKHIQSKIHQDFIITGNIHKIEIDENYPSGHWRRYYVSKKKSLREYYHRKKELREPQE